MSFVHVWPDRFPTRWDGGDQVEDLRLFPRVYFLDALKKRYDTDAHFSPAMLEDREHFPAMKKNGFPEKYKALLRFHVVVMDVDAPDHAFTEQWGVETLQKLQGTPWDGCIKYQTLGGYRFLWELPEPLELAAFERVTKAVWRAMMQAGIKADALFDWNRCYRLPFVTRNDKKTDFKPRAQALPFYDSDNPILPVALLPQEELAAPSSFGQDLMSAPARVSLDMPAAGRNDLLYRLGCSLRNLSWIEDDLLVRFLDEINNRQFPLNPLPLEEVERVALNVCRQHKPGDGPTLQEMEEEGPDKPEIWLKAGDLDSIVQEAIQSLTSAPNLYVRNGKLVRLTEEGIETLPKPALRTLMAACADYKKIKIRDEKTVEVKADPPVDLVDCVFSDERFEPLRKIEQILTVPSMRPDGTILSAPGYDAGLRAFYAPKDVAHVDVPATVTQEMAAEALERLKDLLADFPYVHRHHRAATLSAMMTPVLRTAIEGPTPLFLFDSPTPGSGKSLQADIVSLIALGKDAPRKVQAGDDEMRKEIAAELEAGARLVLIDNVEKPLGGAALDSVLTSMTWSGRRLGKTEMMTLQNYCTWMATGNNVSIRGDLARRTIRSLIDPVSENPEERSGYKYANIKKHVLENRASYLRDILIVARGRQQSGFTGVKNFGSFESWSYWTREALIWLGEDDCVETQAAIREGSQTATWAQVVGNLYHVFGGGPGKSESKEFTAKQCWDAVFDALGGGTPEHKAGLSAGYQELVDDQTVKSTAALLKRWTNRVVGGYRLVANHEKKALRGVMYKVENLSKPNLQIVAREERGETA